MSARGTIYYQTRILSIDGGGVRGLVPAVVLAHLEQRLQHFSQNPDARIADYFDLLAGTSTGALIIAGLLTPDKNNRPKYTAQEVVEMYQNNIATIFAKPSMLQNIKSVSGLMDVKYGHQGLDKVVGEYFGDDELKTLLKPCLIPAYNISNNQNYYFKQRLAAKNPQDNYYVADVLKAACAAPTYFPPAQIQAVNKDKKHCFIDGGVFALNPSLAAYSEYRHCYPNQHAKDTMMLSLGTGRHNIKSDCEKMQHWGAIEWSETGSNIMATAIPNASHEHLETVYHHNPNYLRLNKDFDKDHICSLDNSSPEYLNYLVELGKKIVDDNQEYIDKFAKQLIKNDPNAHFANHRRLTKYLDYASQDAPHASAFIGLDTVLSYQQLRQHSLSLSNHLSGQKYTGVVAIMLPNILPFPMALFAAWYSDRTITLINPLYTADELLKQCIDAQVKTIIIAKIFLKTLIQILPKTQIKHIITVEIGDGQPNLKRKIVNLVSFIKYPSWVGAIEGVSINSLDLILANNDYTEHNKNYSNDTALLQYTGGTSGTLKAAILTHENLLSNISQICHWLNEDINHTSTILTALPLYHIFALNINLLLFVHLKARNVLVLNPRDIKQLISVFKKYSIHVITGVNTLFAALINQPIFAKLDWSRFKLTIGGGMATDPKIAKQWQAQTHKPIIQGYGLSECSPVVSVADIAITEFEASVGQALIGTDILILNKDNQVCAIGDIGEVCIKGPQVMAAYWQKPELNEEVFTNDGYFRSGDLGYFNKQKQLFIIGRLKEMIIVSGFNVYPIEIEQVINQHPDVVESACVGVDTKQGELVKVFVVKKAKSHLTKEQLIQHCHLHLTHYKVPKIIEWIDILPKSIVGKILKRKLPH